MIPQYVVGLSSSEADAIEVVGGKAYGLHKLIGFGESVPNGFVVTTQAYDFAVQHSVGSISVDEQMESQLRGAYRNLGSPLVAVRSSATAEDLPGAAFAGQQETYLGVSTEDELIQAVEDCWASLNSDRAVSYRAEREINSAEVSIAVIVQEMVDAEFAGVMFTADPVTGHRGRLVIESNPGLGEAVVSGMVTTDRAIIGEDNTVIERRDGQASTVIRLQAGGGTHLEQGDPSLRLDESQLLAIAEAGRRIRDGFGRPMDIEWAVSRGQVKILQARPMTALPPAPRQLNMFERKTAPMLFELLPQRPTILETEAWIDRGINPLVSGMLRGIAGVNVDYSTSLIRERGVVTEFIPASPKPTLQTPIRLASALLSKGEQGSWKDDDLYARYLQRCSEIDALDLSSLPFSQLVSIPALATDAMQLVTKLRVKYVKPIISSAAKLIAVLAFTGQLSKLSELTITDDTVTHRINNELQKIAEEFSKTPDALGVLSSVESNEVLAALHADTATKALAQHIEEFLVLYGHRETASIMLPRAATWKEDPAPVFQMIQLLANGEGPVARESPALKAVIAHPLLRLPGISGKVRRWTQKLQEFTSVREDTHFEITRTMPAVRNAINEIGERLFNAGALEDPADVWFLDYVLLLNATSVQSLCTPEVLEEAAWRRRRHAELAVAPMISPATLYDLSPVPGAILHGTGSGGGQATGLVRVINSPADFEKLLPGEILVCPATNPSWTPLFARASAVVVDHGSAASHAAIVAREYRIPAVMGCANATSTLSDGQEIRVDGDRGLVFEGSDG